MIHWIGWKTTTVWPLRPASGGVPKRESKILQKLHAYVHRDVWWAASQSGFRGHQATHVVLGAPGAWPEARTNFASPGLWEQAFSHEVLVEGPPQYPVTRRQRGRPSHHRWVHIWGNELPHHSRGVACNIWQIPPKVELLPYLWCTKREAHCLQVSSREWFPILQLQGILLCCTYGPCRGGLQVHLGGPRLAIQPLFGDEPTFSPRKTARRVMSSFVQIDQSGIPLPRLSRRNNYINYLCLHFRRHFTFFTWYLLRTFSGMLWVTDIAFYVLQKLTDFLAKQNHDLLQSAREYSWQEHQLQLVIHTKPLIEI